MMDPVEAVARALDASEPRFPLLISVAEAQVLLDWGLAEEAVDGWMDWMDENLRDRLVAFIGQAH